MRRRFWSGSFGGFGLGQSSSSVTLKKSQSCLRLNGFGRSPFSQFFMESEATGTFKLAASASCDKPRCLRNLFNSTFGREGVALDRFLIFSFFCTFGMPIHKVLSFAYALFHRNHEC